jgi:hypothetical protein
MGEFLCSVSMRTCISSVVQQATKGPSIGTDLRQVLCLMHSTGGYAECPSQVCMRFLQQRRPTSPNAMPARPRTSLIV